MRSAASPAKGPMQVTIRSVLDRHAAGSHALGIRDCVGDAALLDDNSILRHVRETLFGLGFSISASPPFDYGELPLLSLRDIYRTRVVPYRPNLAPLVKLEDECPRVFTLLDAITCGLRPNPIAHESAHCIARTFIEAEIDESARALDRPLGVACVQLAESFANTVEAFAGLASRSDVQAALYRLNAYFAPETARPDFSALIDEAGFAAAFATTLTAYLCANFLWREANATAIKRALSVGAPSLVYTKALRKPVRNVFEFAMGLSPEFRLRTTSCFFKREGISRPITKLLDLDVVEMLESEPRLGRIIARLGQICADGPDKVTAH